MTSAGDARSCGHGRDRLADELRAVALLALDRLDPLLARLRTPAAGAPGAAGPCPLCVALAAVHAERPEPARRLVEHAAGLATALRDALAEPAPAAPPPPAPTRRVQHIPVDRAPADPVPGGTPC
jgi:hypothetical protein